VKLPVEPVLRLIALGVSLALADYEPIERPIIYGSNRWGEMDEGNLRSSSEEAVARSLLLLLFQIRQAVSISVFAIHKGATYAPDPILNVVRRNMHYPTTADWLRY
jgi:hypothetical protein